MELEDKYDGRCWLCLNMFDHTSKEKRACVDHDHHNGTVRGMLCGSCNVGIGHLGDDLEGICRAFIYLYQGIGDNDLADTITTEYGIKYDGSTD